MVTKPKSKKSGLSTTKWLAFFVVLVMVVSTVSFSLLSGSPEQSTQPVEPIQNQPAIELSFSSIAPAKVVEFLPATLFLATMLTPDVDQIDSVIYAVPGVTLVNSTLSMNPQIPNAFLYRAEIRFDKKQTSLDVLSKKILLGTSESLRNHQYFPYALVELPKKVSFQNTDLNLSKEHFFLDQLATAVVGETTFKDDVVQVQLDAVFSGSLLKSLNIVEVSNPAAVSKTFSMQDTFVVDGLQPVLLLAQEVPLKSDLSQQALQDRLQSIGSVSFLDIRLLPKEPVQFTVDGALDLSAFETAVRNVPNTYDFWTPSSTQPFSFSVSLNTVDDFSVLEKAIRAELVQQSVPETSLSFAAWPIVVQIRLELESNANSAQVSESVVDSLAGILENPDIYQLGRIKTSELRLSTTDADVQIFKLPSGEFNALLIPGVLADQNVSLQIQFDAIRNRITDVSAVQVN